MKPLRKLLLALPSPCASRRSCVLRLFLVSAQPSRRTAVCISSRSSLRSTCLGHAATKAGAKTVAEGREMLAKAMASRSKECCFGPLPAAGRHFNNV